MKKKRKKVDDEVSSSESQQELSSVDGDEELENRGVTCIAQMAGLSSDHPLLNFYIADRAASFIDKYQPCNERDPMVIRMSEAKLRSILKAYVCSVGDPLKVYSMRLRLAGFYPTVDITGDMVYLVKEKHFEKADNSWMIEAENITQDVNVESEND